MIAVCCVLPGLCAETGRCSRSARLNVRKDGQGRIRSYRRDVAMLMQGVHALFLPYFVLLPHFARAASSIRCAANVSGSPNTLSSHRDSRCNVKQSFAGWLGSLDRHLCNTPTCHKVDRAELKQALENPLQPCSQLRFERKQRRERQEAAAAAAQRAECWKENFMLKMEALDQSKASHFLEVVSAELRQRRWQIRDIFRDVDSGKSGALSECCSC